MNDRDTLSFVSGYESYRPKTNKKLLFWVAFAIHVLLLSALIVIPLTQVGPDLPEFESMATFLVRSPSPPPPPPPPVPARPDPGPSPPQAALLEASFVAPVALPDTIPVDELGAGDYGVSGGVEGGVAFGVVGGIVGGLPTETDRLVEPEAPVRLDFHRQEARPVHRVEPVYPQLAAQARVQGAVIVEVLVDRNGVPSELNVLRTVPLLEEAAVDAVEAWRWNPYVVAGKAVPFWVVVTVTFRLT